MGIQGSTTRNEFSDLKSQIERSEALHGNGRDIYLRRQFNKVLEGGAEGGISPEGIKTISNEILAMVPVLVALAQDRTSALANLPSNDDDIIQTIRQIRVAIIAAGGIEVLVALARKGSVNGKAQAAFGLANLSSNMWADDIIPAMAAMRAVDGIPVLVALAQDGSDSDKANAAHTLANLATNMENKRAIADTRAIPVLVALVQDGSDSSKVRAAEALSNLAEGMDSEVINAIVKADAIPVLNNILQDPNSSENTKAMARQVLPFLEEDNFVLGI